MSCNNKNGWAHHLACECREIYFKNLERRIKELEGRLDMCTKENAFVHKAEIKLESKLKAMTRKLNVWEKGDPVNEK